MTNNYFTKAPIAIFDLLGFRDLVNGISLKDLPKIFDQVFDLKINASIKYGQEPFVRAKLISDTVLIYTDPKTVIDYGLEKFDEVNSLLQSACLFLSLCNKAKLAVRGSVTFGDYFVDSKHGIIMGPALITAYDLEKQQDWMGAIVDPNYEKLFHDSFDRYQFSMDDENLMLIDYPAPMKSGQRRNYCCLGWIHYNYINSDKTKNEIRQAFLRSKSELKIDHQVYRKMQNTLSFVDHCVELRFKKRAQDTRELPETINQHAQP